MQFLSSMWPDLPAFTLEIARYPGQPHDQASNKALTSENVWVDKIARVGMVEFCNVTAAVPAVAGDHG